MKRTSALVIAIFIVIAGAPTAPAQEWAKRMFKVTNHDFGSVAHGTQPEYSFELTNVYEQDVHISDVRSSCGCTTPKVAKATLKTYEKGSISAVFNTRSFSGQKTATITVVFDKPYYAEVQLQVQGNIRNDVMIEPNVVEFGQVEQGNSAEQRIRLSRNGDPRWQLSDVRSANAHIEVEMLDESRSGSTVTYELLVRLKSTAPEGYVQDQLALVTNDESRRLTVPVQGRVTSAMSVSPSSLFLGVLEPGQQVTRQLVVRGKTPFRVVHVKCNDDAFRFQTSEEAKTLHLIPVTFHAEKPGTIAQTIVVRTSDGAVGSCVATARVKSANRSY